MSLYGIAPIRKSLVGCEELLGIAMCLAGISAASDLNGINAECFKFCKCLIKGEACEEVSKYAEFHFLISYSYILLYRI
jgi:hypothetical protein